MRTALYARIFNSVDSEGNNSAGGEALADALHDTGGALFARLFVEEGTAALEDRLRTLGSVTFEGALPLQPCVGGRVHSAVHVAHPCPRLVCVAAQPSAPTRNRCLRRCTGAASSLRCRTRA